MALSEWLAIAVRHLLHLRTKVPGQVSPDPDATILPVNRLWSSWLGAWSFSVNEINFPPRFILVMIDIIYRELAQWASI